MHVVILAGGGGTRLWPISQKCFPKQFHAFTDQDSILQKTVQRFISAPFTERLVISTNALYAPLVKEQIATDCEVIIEPVSKNTAGGIALAIKYLDLKDTEEVLIVPADHYIKDVSKLYHAIEQAKVAMQDNKIVVLGVWPDRPETGYGYIELGDLLSKHIYHVKTFTEKPDLVMATSFCNTKNYLWNVGIFGFTVKTFWHELSLYAPEIVQNFSSSYTKALADFSSIPSISIDYALMEKTREAVVVILDTAWSDIGSWDRVYEIMEKDQNQNVKRGNVVDFETKNSLIFGGKKLISTLGVEDLLVVETDEAVLIAKKGESEKVRLLLDEFSKSQKKGIKEPIERHHGN